MLRQLLLTKHLLRKLLAVIYVVIGVIVAAGHQYFSHLGGLKPIAAAILAVCLWPLVLFGVSLHFK
jgi:hypothetical protein